MRISKSFTFDAAHRLPDYEGKCANLHGHTYTLEVVVEGDVNPASGMVMDFGLLKDVVKTVLENYDHAYLNDLMHNPTAENIIIALFEELSVLLDMQMFSAPLYKLILWETPTSYVELRREDLQ